MKKVIKIDSLGLYVEDIIIKGDESTPSDCVETPCPDGFYRPKWTGAEWIEDMTLEEINALNNQPKEPTLEEKNRADIDYLSIMTGVDLYV